MAIILEAAYSKKLGLPNYSSHSYVVSIRTELSDLTQAEAESARLYALLQQSVDSQIQQVGFLPEATTYGMITEPTNGDGHHEHQAPATDGNGDQWTCSDKQKELILKLVEQHGLDKHAVETLAKELFGVPVKTLNRLQASGLIEELLERYAKGSNGHPKARNARGNGGYQRRATHTRA